MKQLKIIYAVATFMGCALFTGCNDDYLQKYPEDSLNEEAFFKTVTDLETYTNGFYGMFGASYDDLFSDNIGHGKETLYRFGPFMSCVAILWLN